MPEKGPGDDIETRKKEREESDKRRLESLNIKEEIEKTSDYKELYDKSIEILQKMESEIIYLMERTPLDTNLNNARGIGIMYSLFDDKLDTSNPITIFEQKGAELLSRAKDIEEQNRVLVSSIELSLGATGQGEDSLDAEKKFQEHKKLIIDELSNTYMDAIKDLDDDIEEDGIINHSNNIDYYSVINTQKKIFEVKGNTIFWLKEYSPSDFEKQVKAMDDFNLFGGTFNIRDGSGAFDFCYNEVKNRIGSTNLFSYVDALNVQDIQKDALKISIIQGLAGRKKIDDLKSYMRLYPDKDNLIKTLTEIIGEPNKEYYVKKNLSGAKDSLILSFLTSFEELKDIDMFQPIFEKMKENPKVKKILESDADFSNVDMFNKRKVNGLFIYDSEGHGGGELYFSKELAEYKSQNYSQESCDDTPKYTKIVLKKGNNKIVMLKIKCTSGYLKEKESAEFKTVLRDVLVGDGDLRDVNLFALRGHCYSTEKMANVLGELQIVEEGDIFIDGGCHNAKNIALYHSIGIKGYMFAYVGQGRGNNTYRFTNKLIAAVDSGKTLNDVLSYYNNYKGDKSQGDGYFADKAMRPDSVYVRYYCED